ncbi:MAG: hypothetical protein MRJ67_16300 [Nitrospirales bacterium]|nr:hypothetical protein [Nitrospirales bacterium]
MFLTSALEEYPTDLPHFKGTIIFQFNFPVSCGQKEAIVLPHRFAPPYFAGIREESNRIGLSGTVLLPFLP